MFVQVEGSCTQAAPAPLTFVCVQAVSGEELRIQEAQTVEDVQNAVANHWFIPHEYQNLICLHCGASLQSWDVLCGHVVHGSVLSITLLVSVQQALQKLSCASRTLRLKSLASLRQLLQKGTMVRYHVSTAMLKDGDAGVRRVALEVLGEVASTGDDQAISSLCACLNDQAGVVKRVAVEMLGQVAETDNECVLGALINCLEDEDEAVKFATVEALAKVMSKGNREASAAVGHFLRHPMGAVRSAALRTLQVVSLRGDEDVIIAVTNLLKDREAAVRCAAVKTLAALAEWDDTHSMLALHGTLEDADSSVRRTVVCMLAQIAVDLARALLAQSSSDEEAIATMIACLKMQYSGVRRASLESLSIMADKADNRVIMVARALAEDEDADVRRVARITLDSFG